MILKSRRKIAILDDYQDLALKLADWNPVLTRAEVHVFNKPLCVPNEAAEALQPFDVVCLLRERMAMPGVLLRRLPKLKFIAVTGSENRTLDLEAASALGITVSTSAPRMNNHSETSELAWGLILALVRRIPYEAQSMKLGLWQNSLGVGLRGKTLGLLGLGRLGAQMVPVGRAFGMDVIAWSPNLTLERADAAGARYVDKDTLLSSSDVLSLHLVLAEETQGIISRRELAMMKPSAFLINTSRGPLIDEAELVDALQSRRIAGAGLDVFDVEPLPHDHRLRELHNAVLTPHLGYVTEETMRAFYQDTVENILAYLNGQPIRAISRVPPTELR